MDVVVPLAALLAAALLPRALVTAWAGRARRGAASAWRTQVDLWEAYLRRDPWDPPGAGGSLRWVGTALEGSVLPGADDARGGGADGDRRPA
ncbi:MULTISPECIES: hypothetical protein [unclassified Blastococcus]